MKIVSCLTLLFALILTVNQKAGYCQGTEIVSWQPPQPVTIARGESTELLVTVKIKDGFHLQANPVANQFLVPTSLTMKPGNNLVMEAPIYPEGHPFTLKGSPEVLSTYEKKLVIRLPVTVLSSAKIGPKNVTGELSFQPCNSRSCLFPRSIPVSIPVMIIAKRQ